MCFRRSSIEWRSLPSAKEQRVYVPSLKTQEGRCGEVHLLATQELLSEDQLNPEFEDTLDNRVRSGFKKENSNNNE